MLRYSACIHSPREVPQNAQKPGEANQIRALRPSTTLYPLCNCCPLLPKLRLSEGADKRLARMSRVFSDYLTAVCRAVLSSDGQCCSSPVRMEAAGPVILYADAVIVLQGKG